MVVPSFDEFMKSIGEAGVDSIMDSHFKEMSETYDSNDPHFLSVLFSKCVTCSVDSAVDVLRRYHQWLSECLAAQEPPKG